MAILKTQSEEITVVRKFLAINDLPEKRVFVLNGSDLNYFASLPRTVRNDAGTMSTDVVRVSHFVFVDRLILRGREAHNNRDW